MTTEIQWNWWGVGDDTRLVRWRSMRRAIRRLRSQKPGRLSTLYRGLATATAVIDARTISRTSISSPPVIKIELSIAHLY
jgi:hypothetical protein